MNGSGIAAGGRGRANPPPAPRPPPLADRCDVMTGSGIAAGGRGRASLPLAAGLLAATLLAPLAARAAPGPGRADDAAAGRLGPITAIVPAAVAPVAPTITASGP